MQTYQSIYDSLKGESYEIESTIKIMMNCFSFFSYSYYEECIIRNCLPTKNDLYMINKHKKSKFLFAAHVTNEMIIDFIDSFEIDKTHRRTVLSTIFCIFSEDQKTHRIIDLYCCIKNISQEDKDFFHFRIDEERDDFSYSFKHGISPYDGSPSILKYQKYSIKNIKLPF